VPKKKKKKREGGRGQKPLLDLALGNARKSLAAFPPEAKEKKKRRREKRLALQAPPW